MHWRRYALYPLTPGSAEIANIKLKGQRRRHKIIPYIERIRLRPRGLYVNSSDSNDEATPWDELETANRPQLTNAGGSRGTSIYQLYIYFMLGALGMRCRSGTLCCLLGRLPQGRRRTRRRPAPPWSTPWSARPTRRPSRAARHCRAARDRER